LQIGVFGISVDKICDGFGLKLEGDYDATSAYELIYAIKKLPGDNLRISIHTDGLKNISISPKELAVDQQIEPL
jgi:hypothetical protein